MPVKTVVLACVLLISCSAGAKPNRRALLIGINEYLGASKDRDWPDLSGAVNDVRVIEERLLARYGFTRHDVVTLTDGAATRAAILQAIERHLVQTAAKGDIVFFYFAGHGSQVRNSRSDEPDGYDESLVPADGRDIRDKELRPLFNRILDRGARLTIVFDNCHSGSGARGTRVRGIRPDERDVADGRHYGPRPENRGALVLSATGDDQDAWETRGNDGKMHGAFTWALLRALQDAVVGEPAAETFLRAHARLQGERKTQTPVMAGNDEARRRPFLEDAVVRERIVAAVETVRGDGTAVLQAGVAHGLTEGLRFEDLTITKLLGPGRSEARSEKGKLRPGDVVEIKFDRLRFWNELQSRERSPYRLEVRRVRDGSIVCNGRLIGNEIYSIVLQPVVTPAPRRYVYVFVIDSHGKSFLALPQSGSVENRYPLVDPGKFRVLPPYGTDTFFLLTTDEPLPNPWILEWDGVRTRKTMPANWSVEKYLFTSVPPE